MNYFGKPWDAPVTEFVDQGPTPVGELCLWCEEPIQDGDRGILLPCIGLENEQVRIRPEHLECHLRQIIGGIAHLEKRCICCGGTDDPDDHMPPHAAALAVLDYIERVWRGGSPL